MIQNIKKHIIFICLILTILGYFLWSVTHQPSNDRDWQNDVAILAYAERDDNKITIHNIRNFEYKTAFHYIPSYYTQEFHLDDLESIDLIASYWMGPVIAHTFLSFGFNDGKKLAISIEIRKEKNEQYSVLKGFFRQYELYYVVADERDVIRLRTNYRNDPAEEVYLYSLKGTKENMQNIFLEYINKINQLKENPEFYNTLTTNCTTNIWLHSRVNPQHLPLNWKILASGYLPEYLYENNRIESYGLSFPELQKHAKINHRALLADKDKNFSLQIRKDLK